MYLLVKILKKLSHFLLRANKNLLKACLVPVTIFGKMQ